LSGGAAILAAAPALSALRSPEEGRIMARKKTTSFIGRIDTHAKTARPANVGPHDVGDDQHDPGSRGVTPERGYKPRPDDLATTAGPGTPGKAPVNIPPKARDGGPAPEGTERHTAPGRGKTDTPSLPEE